MPAVCGDAEETDGTVLIVSSQLVTCKTVFRSIGLVHMSETVHT